MNITESIASALSGILGNKMRSILTMFGIIVGIASVIMIISIGEGFSANISKQFESLGMSNMTLQTNSETETIEIDDLLTLDDVEALKKYDELLAVSAYYSFYSQASLPLLDGDKSLDIEFMGTDEDYFEIENVDLASGRLIVPQDIKSSASVVIINEDIAAAVFGRTDVIGQTLDFQTYWSTLSCQVIGVIKSDQRTQMMLNYNYGSVYMPVSTLKAAFWDDDMTNIINIKATDATSLKRIGDNVIRLVELRHGNEGENKYMVSALADQLGEANTVITMFTLFLGFVAGISLLVGGIGVMNIMLVSVTERTREIGIRKSLGATAGNIQFQFLIEAVILTALGGLVGIGLGLAGGTVLGNFASGLMGEPIVPVLSTGSIVLVVSISAFIGIAFGVYPARQAAKLDPIEALRFES